MTDKAQHLLSSSSDNHPRSNLQQQSRRNSPFWMVTVSVVSLIAGYSFHGVLSLHPNLVADHTTKFQFKEDRNRSRNRDHASTTISLELNLTSFSASQSSHSSFGPKVAWLLSWPNSGTSYTLANIQRLTNQSIASNYAKEWGDAPLSVGSNENGPFVNRKLYYPLPQHYILTKTHCGGYCSICKPERFVLNTVEEFEQQCRLATIPKRAKQFYPKGTAARAIHLIRHPLDNLVARMHLALKKNRVAPQKLPEFDAQVAQLNTERERVLAWCNYTDSAQPQHFRTTTLLSNATKRTILRQQPLCALELFRYVQWHERAREMTTQLGLPVLYVYYEDYAPKTYNATVSRILDFLEATPKATPLPFAAHSPYTVFTPEQRATMGRYVRRLASKEGWKLVERYFQ